MSEAEPVRPATSKPLADATAQDAELETFPLLQVDRLTKVFALPAKLLRRRRWLKAIDDVSLFLMPGETLGVVGASGSGKTTLARCVLRLLQPDFGQIAFNGENITDLSPQALRPIRQRMQPVFQDPRTSLDPELTVSRIVAEGLTVGASSYKPATAHRQSLEWMARVGLGPEFADRKPNALSAGERQRVALARALAVEPSLVVCDEALTALDVSVRAQMVNLLLDLQGELGLSYLFISHDLPIVRYVSHRIAVMLMGRLVETGPAELVYGAPSHPYTQSLVQAVVSVSAVPRRLELLLAGPTNSHDAQAAGCPLFHRCPRAEAGVCDVVAPDLAELQPESGHWVACHHPE